MTAFADKVRSLGYLARGRTRDRVREGRREDGVRFKAVTDELNNTVTQYSRDDSGGDSGRQDVHIRAPLTRLRGRVEEVRTRGTE